MTFVGNVSNALMQTRFAQNGQNEAPRTTAGQATGSGKPQPSGAEIRPRPSGAHGGKP